MIHLEYFTLHENRQQADKLISRHNATVGNNYKQLIADLSNNNKINYLGFFIKILLKELSNNNLDRQIGLNHDMIIELADKIKLLKIDISKYNDYKLIDDVKTDVDDTEVRLHVTQFVNKWAPSKFRSTIKTSNLLDELVSNVNTKHLKVMDKDAITSIKKLSYLDDADEWAKCIVNIFNAANETSINMLKDSNIKLYYEDDEWFIYKPLDFESYNLANYAYWCTMTETFYDQYSELDLIITLNKLDKRNSYISYMSTASDDIAFFNYVNNNVSIKDNTILTTTHKFHSKK